MKNKISKRACARRVGNKQALRQTETNIETDRKNKYTGRQKQTNRQSKRITNKQTKKKLAQMSCIIKQSAHSFFNSCDKF